MHIVSINRQLSLIILLTLTALTLSLSALDNNLSSASDIQMPLMHEQYRDFESPLSEAVLFDEDLDGEAEQEIPPSPVAGTRYRLFSVNDGEVRDAGTIDAAAMDGAERPIDLKDDSLEMEQVRVDIKSLQDLMAKNPDELSLEDLRKLNLPSGIFNQKSPHHIINIQGDGADPQPTVKERIKKGFKFADRAIAQYGGLEAAVIAVMGIVDGAAIKFDPFKNHAEIHFVSQALLGDRIARFTPLNVVVPLGLKAPAFLAAALGIHFLEKKFIPHELYLDSIFAIAALWSLYDCAGVKKLSDLAKPAARGKIFPKKHDDLSKADAQEALASGEPANAALLKAALATDQTGGMRRRSDRGSFYEDSDMSGGRQNRSYSAGPSSFHTGGMPSSSLPDGTFAIEIEA